MPFDRNEVSARHILESLVAGIFDSGRAAVIDHSFQQQIGPFVEHATTDIRVPEEILREVFSSDRCELLDFGCGTGAYRSSIEEIGYRWTGVNYREGMQDGAAAEAAHASMDRLHFYDGLYLPFADGAFDVVYSFQTFEHIQSMDITFGEIFRVLKSGGSLVGAVSYLEQIHDYSTFNFTPYGLKIAAERSGLQLVRIYPRYDAFTFLLRRLLIVTSDKPWPESDSNSLTAILQADNSIGQGFVEYGRKLGLSAQQTNLLRLMFSTHFIFQIRRP